MCDADGKSDGNEYWAVVGSGPCRAAEITMMVRAHQKERDWPTFRSGPSEKCTQNILILYNNGKVVRFSWLQVTKLCWMFSKELKKFSSCRSTHFRRISGTVFFLWCRPFVRVLTWAWWRRGAGWTGCSRPRCWWRRWRSRPKREFHAKLTAKYYNIRTPFFPFHLVVHDGVDVDRHGVLGQDLDKGKKHLRETLLIENKLTTTRYKKQSFERSIKIDKVRNLHWKLKLCFNCLQYFLYTLLFSGKNFCRIIGIFLPPAAARRMWASSCPPSGRSQRKGRWRRYLWKTDLREWKK